MTGQEEFIGQAKKVSLTPSERATIKMAILEAVHAKNSHRSFGLWLLTFKGITSIVVSVFIVTAVGSVSASYAAESAVPGDLLYPVKIHVNESIRKRLATSPEAAASWEAEKAERRLKEAEALVARSKLNAMNKALIRTAFLGNVQAVRTHLIAMRSESGSNKANDLRSAFSLSLQAHSSLLQRLKASQESGALDIGDLVDDVQNAAMESESENDLSRISTPSSDIATLNTVLVKTQARIDASRSIIGKSDDSLTPATRSLAERKLEIASAALDSANALLDHPREALQIAKTALRNAKEAELILLSKFPVQGDASATPENLTGALESERQNDVRFSADARLQSANRKLKKVESRMRSASGSEQEIRDSLPLQTRVDGAKQLMDIANTQMEEGNMDAALKTSDMALKHANAAQDSLEKLRKEGRKNEQKENREPKQEKEEND